MICARCGTHEGIKGYDDVLLCNYCFKIKTTADNIIDIALANDRLRIEKLIEGIYDKGFNDGCSQCMKDVRYGEISIS